MRTVSGLPFHCLVLLIMLASSSLARSDAPERFYCQLKALTASRRAAHEALTKRLFDAVQQRRELPDGLELRIDSHTVSLVDLATWAQAEHLCCPFLRLALDQEPKAGPLWLRLTGPEGVKDFLLAEMGDRAK
jgi:hypothetical protein